MMRRLIPIFAAVIAISLVALTRSLSAEPAGPYNWTGFYVGGNVGWMWAKADTTAAVPGTSITATMGGLVVGTALFPPLAIADSTHPNGVIGGMQFGYDWESASNWIAGFETDIQASEQSATGNPPGIANSGTIGNVTNTITSAASHTDSVGWFGTVRGRVGYRVWPGMMVYGTGGLAYGHVSSSAVVTSSLTACVGLNCLVNVTTSTNGTSSAVKTGWAAGGGIAGVVPNNPRLTWKVEYLHVDLGSNNFSFNAPPFFPTGSVISVSSKFTEDIVRVGADYHF